MVEFRILGPVEVMHEGSVISVGGPRHRRLLAVLVLYAGRVVPAATLIDALWGDAPPRSASAMLHVRVSELRSALRVCGAPVVSGRGGYQLRIAAEDVDAERFERLATAGAEALADGDPTRAATDLRAGLALWRGPALAEFADEIFARSDAARLTELRLQALENRFAADLELGRHRELVAELEKVVTDHPLRERFWEQHMLALYRAGRQGDALGAYQAARQQLADELGLDPGNSLQRLHQAILTADPALDLAATPHDIDPRAGAGATGATAAARVVPAQLPADVSAFTGRTDQLRRLDDLLADDRRPAPGVAVAVVSGTAGVGKTALAIHWAHRRRDRFPDGQLYVNLRGYDPDQPLTAADALGRFLTGLGVAGGDVPLHVDDRATRYRTEIAGRRMLVVLDNASSAEQVRPLLPGVAGCAVLVTSRDRLAGLVARDGADRLDLDLLPHHDADTLLRRLIGGRADAEPHAVSALAARCARLPLALRVAAELAIARPTAPLSALVHELTDEQRRLDSLDAGGDPHAAVPTVFSWSIRDLPDQAARTFRLLGLHPGAAFDSYAAAALAGTDLTAARRALDALARAHLLQPLAPDRYGMHDLLRAYAASLARRQDSEAAREGAVDRLLDYYLATAVSAVGLIHPADARRRPRTVTEPTTPVPDLPGSDEAVAWLDTERQTIVAIAAHATRHGRPGHTVHLSSVLFRYLDAGHNVDALVVHEYARQAAERSGDVAGQADALTGLGIVHLRLGQYDSGTSQLRQALTLFAEAGDLLGQARALGNLGIAAQLQGRYAPAADYHRRALDLYRKIGDPSGEAHSIDDLGLHEQRLGRHRRAADHHTRALTIFRDIGDQHGAAIALNNLGDAEQRLGLHEQAVDHLRQSLALSRQIGDRTGEAWSLTCLGDAHNRAGRAAEASHHHREALTTFREIGDRDGQPRALNGLGEAARLAEQATDALRHHAAALAHAHEINAPDQKARAHAGLGHAHRSLGDLARARHHYGQALALYDSLASPEARDIRARLAELAPELTSCAAMD
jgi:DNA-binding SARP family transcriptional activator